MRRSPRCWICCTRTPPKQDFQSGRSGCSPTVWWGNFWFKRESSCGVRQCASRLRVEPALLILLYAPPSWIAVYAEDCNLAGKGLMLARKGFQ